MSKKLIPVPGSSSIKVPAGKLGSYRIAFVKQVLRRASYKWPARGQAIKEARIERGRYECNRCQEVFGPRDIQADHIDPVVDPSIGFVSWDSYILRLLVGREGWQVLCRGCHDRKTIGENQVRRNSFVSTKQRKKEK